MIYTAWGNGDGYAHSFHGSGERPKYGNGEFMEDCPSLVWVIEADSWGEACTKYHILQGWEPYVPFDYDQAAEDARRRVEAVQAEEQGDRRDGDQSHYRNGL